MKRTEHEIRSAIKELEKRMRIYSRSPFNWQGMMEDEYNSIIILSDLKRPSQEVIDTLQRYIELHSDDCGECLRISKSLLSWGKVTPTAIDVLEQYFDEYPDPYLESDTLSAIHQGFTRGQIPDGLTRQIITYLIRKVMSTDDGNAVEIIEAAISWEQSNEETVVAAVETLIGVPERSSLIDYLVSKQLLSKMIETNSVHPIVREILEGN